jgi:coenzyme F420 hydrogenase subunit beta
MENFSTILLKNVIKPGCCTGCGACVALDATGKAFMQDGPAGPSPVFPPEGHPATATSICPAYRLSYPDLYRSHYDRVPERWLLGLVMKTRTGFAAHPAIRRAGASGGVLTATLLYLLESGRVDAVIAARQGLPTPLQAKAVICRTPEEIQACAQSVYIPVAMLEVLRTLEPGQRYAMTCLPDQAAALRALQQAGFAPARQIVYVVGPYTGTALEPKAITTYLRSKGVKPNDSVTSLKWRAGEWPGHLEIITTSGKVLRSPKVYYNFLIPFFVTQNSLQNMDFANEFADLAVGDAWSPAFEAKGQGFSVITTRTPAMEAIIAEMETSGILTTEAIDPLKAAEMHGHMMDFKKRGGYLRNSFRRRLGLPAPDFGMKPSPLPASRIVVEVIISGIFLVCRNRVAHGLLALIPESIIGPLFNRLRLGWKSLSKPTKRKGLADLTMIETGGTP